MNYFYEATDGSGQTVLGKIDADSLPEAHRLLTERGYLPQSVAPNPAPQGAGVGESITLMGNLNGSGLTGMGTYRAGASGLTTAAQHAQSAQLTGSNAVSPYGSALEPARIDLAPAKVRPPTGVYLSDRGGVSSKDLLLFFQQMAPLVKSGMTLYTSLDNLAKRTRNRALADVAHEMAETARKGGRITDVMSRYPRIFPEHVVGTIRAGELGGFMEIVLGEVAINYEQNIALYRGSWQWRAIVVQALLTLALTIPLFSSILDSTNMAANLRLYANREAIVLAIFGLLYFGVMCAVKYVQTPHMRRWRDTTSLKLPVFGDLQRLSALSAFVRMLRKLYNAGVGPIHAWEAAMNTADNSVIRDSLASAYVRIQRGESLADAFAATGLFADNVEQIVVTGQLSGEVVQSLDQAAEIYQQRVQDAHDRARSTMWKMARVTAIVVGGIALIWMFKNYFASVFGLVEKEFPENQ